MYITSNINIIFLFILMFTCRDNIPKPEKVSAPVRPAVIPKDYFMNPLNRPIVLAGTFCELRPNHFHTGIDIKSAAGVVGDPIYAAADGYISRISIAPDGYGNAIYIDHPNGYTTVYGHLLQFYPELEKYVREEQARQQHFDVELYPEKGRFTVTKGFEIAKMGNTGASRGAHLHFEIRETDTENPVNPLLFGISVVDHTPPAINYFRTYSINSSWDKFDAKNILITKRAGIYVPRNGGDTLRVYTDTIGVGINTRDQMAGTWNKNGVYLINMYCDDKLMYVVRMDSTSFYKTRMVNAHMDYTEARNKRNFVHQCFTLPGNKLAAISQSPTNGLIVADRNRARKILFEVFDFNMNKSSLVFYIKRDTSTRSFRQDRYDYLLYYDKENRIRTPRASIDFPAHTFFRNQKISYVESADRSSNFFSDEHQIGTDEEPLFTYYKMTIKANPVPGHLRSKCFIASCDNHGRIRNWGGSWLSVKDTVTGEVSQWMQSDIKEYGNFFITADTIPPKVVPIIFGKNMQRAKKIVFTISDNISVAGRTPLLNYRAFIDGQWALFEYDLKTGTITYHFDSSITPGEHTLVLEVYDAQQNVKRYEGKFIR